MPVTNPPSELTTEEMQYLEDLVERDLANDAQESAFQDHPDVEASVLKNKLITIIENLNL